MIITIFACLWYLLPAAIGNHSASCGNRLWLPRVFKSGLEKLAIPVDLDRTWRGQEIFGKNKTWRGVVVGAVAGVLVASIQAALFFGIGFFKQNTIVDFGQVNCVMFGFLMGSGALAGDLVKSFIKRRLNKASGRPWFPWDQLDWIFGAIIAS
jgi:CDP-2,3-bis-(O-geranylgeranyl)-sn-glycerol synthase